MPDTVHIHEDDLELYNGGRLEPERILAVERHLSDCQTCRERLSQCVGVPLEATGGTWLARYPRYSSVSKCPR